MPLQTFGDVRHCRGVSQEASRKQLVCRRSSPVSILSRTGHMLHLGRENSVTSGNSTPDGIETPSGQSEVDSRNRNDAGDIGRFHGGRVERSSECWERAGSGGTAIAWSLFVVVVERGGLTGGRRRKRTTTQCMGVAKDRNCHQTSSLISKVWLLVIF